MEMKGQMVNFCCFLTLTLQCLNGQGILMINNWHEYPIGDPTSPGRCCEVHQCHHLISPLYLMVCNYGNIVEIGINCKSI